MGTPVQDAGVPLPAGVEPPDYSNESRGIEDRGVRPKGTELPTPFDVGTIAPSHAQTSADAVQLAHLDRVFDRRDAAALPYQVGERPTELARALQVAATVSPDTYRRYMGLVARAAAMTAGRGGWLEALHNAVLGLEGEGAMSVQRGWIKLWSWLTTTTTIAYDAEILDLKTVLWGRPHLGRMLSMLRLDQGAYLRSASVAGRNDAGLYKTAILAAQHEQRVWAVAPDHLVAVFARCIEVTHDGKLALDLADLARGWIFAQPMYTLFGYHTASKTGGAVREISRLLVPLASLIFESVTFGETWKSEARARYQRNLLLFANGDLAARGPRLLAERSVKVTRQQAQAIVENLRVVVTEDNKPVESPPRGLALHAGFVAHVVFATAAYRPKPLETILADMFHAFAAILGLLRLGGPGGQVASLAASEVEARLREEGRRASKGWSERMIDMYSDGLGEVMEKQVPQASQSLRYAITAVFRQAATSEYEWLDGNRNAFKY